jgi:hypothetical protein
MSRQKTNITNSLTLEEVNDYFHPLEDDFLAVAKVISYVAQIPLPEIKDTSIYYNLVKECLKESGFPGEVGYYPVFNSALNKAKEYYLTIK